MKKGTFTGQNIAYNKFETFMKHSENKTEAPNLYEKVKLFIKKSNHLEKLMIYLLAKKSHLDEYQINFTKLPNFYSLLYVKNK